MSMMNILKRVFGFTPDADEDDDYNPSLPQYAVSQPAEQTSANATYEEQPLYPEPDTNKKALNEKKGTQIRNSSELEKLRQENHRLQLSVNRQKRALLDRINHLEAQVARHNEEKDKLFSNNLGAKALAKANARIKQLEAEKAALLEGEDGSTASFNLTADIKKQAIEMETLRLKLQSRESELDAREQELKRRQQRIERSEPVSLSELSKLEDECKRLKEELEAKTTACKQFEVKTEMSDKMINDLRNRLAASNNELEAFKNEQIEVMTEIQSQIEGFREIKERKNAKIKELQESIASYKRTIEKNISTHGDVEKKLREEITALENKLLSAQSELEKANDEKSKLQQMLNERQASVESNNPMISVQSESPAPGEPIADDGETPEKPKKKRGRPRKIQIDQDLDNTDWFTNKPLSDFGYQEPPRRPANDNAAQLSLF